MFFSTLKQSNEIAIDTLCNNGCQYLSTPLPSLQQCGLCSSSLCAIHSVAVCVSSFYLHCFCSRAHHFLHMSPPPPPTESLFSFICFVSLVFFCHLPLSSALHLFMLCSHSLGVLPLFSLYAVAVRAQLIFVGSFFVHVVCVCARMCLCVCVSDEFFCVYHFFCRPPSSDVDVGVVLFGAAGRVFFF